MAEKALQVALKSLTHRNLTIGELKNRLDKKGFSEEEIKKALDRLIEWNYVNDYSYAENYCKSYLHRSSRQKIYHDLISKEIDSALANSIIEKNYSNEQELENCIAIAAKIWEYEDKKWDRLYQYKKSYQGASKKIIIQKKVGAKLWQKGFKADIIQQTLEYCEKE